MPNLPNIAQFSFQAKKTYPISIDCIRNGSCKEPHNVRKGQQGIQGVQMQSVKIKLTLERTKGLGSILCPAKRSPSYDFLSCPFFYFEAIYFLQFAFGPPVLQK